MKLPLEEIRSYPLLFDLYEDSLAFPAELARRAIHPPLPILSSNDGPLLVWGRTVLAAAEACGLGTVEAVVYAPADLAPAEAFLVSLALEQRKGSFTWRELGKIAAETSNLGLDDGAAEVFVGPEGCLKAARRWLALPSGLRELAARGMVDLKTAESVRAIPGGILEKLESIAGAASFSERRIFFKTLDEVLKRDGGGGEALAARLLRSELPLEELRAIRYPELSGLEEKLRLLHSRRLKGRGISLKPPPFFEGSRFSVSFEFESPEQLRKKIAALENLAKEDGDELFSLL